MLHRAFCAAVVVCAFALAPSAAEARGHRHHHPHHAYHQRHGHHGHSFADVRPARWCGWYLRQKRGIADPRLNLARNWAHWGRPAAPTPGAVVVWGHHVGELVAHVAGSIWLVHSGNDNHAVRTRPRSIAGAIAVRVPG